MVFTIPSEAWFKPTRIPDSYAGTRIKGALPGMTSLLRFYVFPPQYLKFKYLNFYVEIFELHYISTFTLRCDLGTRTVT